MKLKRMAVFIASLMVIGAGAVGAQTFEDPEGKYKLTLSGDWRAVTYNDAVGRPRTEFVYRDRGEGLLKISRERLDGSLAEVVRREEESLKIYRRGYQNASTEQFGGGALQGIRLAFYHNESNRQMASTYYFLQDGNSVWVLRFSGKRGSLDTIRNLTDQIARSFQGM